LDPINVLLLKNEMANWCANTLLRMQRAYDAMLQGMVERRMKQSIFAVASFWYTAWVNAGQPDLKNLGNKTFTEEENKEFENLDLPWRNQGDTEHTE
jgi:hypothetical protein